MGGNQSKGPLVPPSIGVPISPLYLQHVRATIDQPITSSLLLSSPLSSASSSSSLAMPDVIITMIMSYMSIPLIVITGGHTMNRDNWMQYNSSTTNNNIYVINPFVVTSMVASLPSSYLSSLFTRLTGYGYGGTSRTNTNSNSSITMSDNDDTHTIGSDMTASMEHISPYASTMRMAMTQLPVSLRHDMYYGKKTSMVIINHHLHIIPREQDHRLQYISRLDLSPSWVTAMMAQPQPSSSSSPSLASSIATSATVTAAVTVTNETLIPTTTTITGTAGMTAVASRRRRSGGGDDCKGWSRILLPVAPLDDPPFTLVDSTDGSLYVYNRINSHRNIAIHRWCPSTGSSDGSGGSSTCGGDWLSLNPSGDAVNLYPHIPVIMISMRGYTSPSSCNTISATMPSTRTDTGTSTSTGSGTMPTGLVPPSVLRLMIREPLMRFTPSSSSTTSSSGHHSNDNDSDDSKGKGKGVWTEEATATQFMFNPLHFACITYTSMIPDRLIILTDGGYVREWYIIERRWRYDTYRYGYSKWKIPEAMAINIHHGTFIWIEEMHQIWFIGGMQHTDNVFDQDYYQKAGGTAIWTLDVNNDNTGWQLLRIRLPIHGLWNSTACIWNYPLA